MVGMILVLTGQCRKAPFPRRQMLCAIIANVRSQAHFAAFEPEMLETTGPAVFAQKTKGVQIVFTDITPVFKHDTEFKSSVRRGHHIRFIDIEQTMIQMQSGNSRLADTDGADLVGFNQGYIQLFAHQLAKGRCGHPACSAATGDHHPLFVVLHLPILFKFLYQ